MLPSAASRSRLGLLCAPAATSGRYDRDLHCVKKHPPVGICFGPSSSLVDAGAIQTLPHSRGTSDMLPLCGPLPVLGRGARAGRPSRSRGYPAVKPVLRFVVPQAGRISKLEGVPPAWHRLLCRRLPVDASSCCRGNYRVPGTGIAAGRLFPSRSFIQRSGRLCGFRRPASGRAFRSGELRRTTHAVLRQLARPRPNCCLVGHCRLRGKRGLRWLWPQPS